MVDDFAKAFDELSEPELAKKIRVVSGILRPFVADNPPDWQEIIVDQCMEGAASQDLEQLLRLMQERFNAVKLSTIQGLAHIAASIGGVTLFLLDKYVAQDREGFSMHLARYWFVAFHPEFMTGSRSRY